MSRVPYARGYEPVRDTYSLVDLAESVMAWICEITGVCVFGLAEEAPSVGILGGVLGNPDDHAGSVGPALRQGVPVGGEFPDEMRKRVEMG